jgi:hypothetical protein
LLKEYPAHGGLQIRVESDVIIINARGPWNLEYFSKLHHALIDAAQHVNLDNFGVLINLSGEAIAVQDGLDKHREFVGRTTTKFIAIITSSECNLPSMTKKLFLRTYEGVVDKACGFDSVEAGLAWLRESLDAG